ncbi:MAG: TolC family protein [Flavihumibacter sp.]
MKKPILLWVLLWTFTQSHAQFFNEEVKKLYQKAAEKNDTLQLYRLQKEQTAVDIQSTRFSFLPRVAFTGTYTRLNDDIVFPDNLQAVLMGTQGLLIKEKLGMGFNAALPPGIELQQVDPIQRKNILKGNVNAQWLLFSGFKVSNALKAYQHQQRVYDQLAARQQTKLWMDVSEVYDKMALLQNSEAIIQSSEKILQEQTRFVNAAIRNGLATPLDRKRIELAQQKLEIKKLENKTNMQLLRYRLHQLTDVSDEELQLLHPELVAVALASEAPVNTRPEIKALDAGIAATGYMEKAAMSDYVPKLAAFGQYELRDKDLSLLDPRWFAGVRLQWNVFDGLAARNNARKAVLQRQQLEVQKKSAEDMIRLGQDKLKEDYNMATQKLVLKNAEIKLAEDTYEFVDKQYRNGLAALTDVLDALNDVEKAKFEYQQAVYDQRQAGLKAAELNGLLLNNPQ